MARTQIPSYVTEFVVTAAHANTYWKENEEAHWARITSIYAGKISSAGVAVELPDGWTCSQTATGTYTIVHNLGDTDYVIIAMSSYAGSIMSYTSINDDDTTVKCFTYAGAADDRDFVFILIHYGAW